MSEQSELVALRDRLTALVRNFAAQLRQDAGFADRARECNDNNDWDAGEALRSAADALEAELAAVLAQAPPPEPR